jgi:LPXTG-site transpeptidase (sortase) family protein
MKKRSALNNRLTYGAFAAINLCVLGMFVTILSPIPIPERKDSLVAIAPKRLLGGAEIEKINLGIPTRVVVPSVGIDLPVKVGSYNAVDQTWTLDTLSAFYADRSVPVNDSNGSTLIYGHARSGLFGKLPEISSGATAQVFTDSGKVFSYIFTSSRQVQPDDTSIFVDSGAPVLALQTCSGPFDIYRTLVSFNLEKVTSV